ncbi:phosphoribosylanthranilate isomerase [Flavobacterium nackdongense]|uniref:N-(5'-phosphoribosyl)anthranilate isomerase n=1 Tax=Flavobacterium nackdongense TaxID=2547394 RepID=A0A4P6YBS6_9FLAO|nr:phosphoribosylanthranilate isomerase [Flavobacterium nackdongense]QBN18087.1 phosphoribosylanthranilate isomerase [Flavobacterium nackdongense]
MKLKICGMKYPENILEIGALLPDYMGFIFWEKSARYFDGAMPDLPKSIKKVGVFVNASLDEILDKIQKYDLQAVQLHGQESVEFCKNLKKNIPNLTDIIKVFSILDTFDFAELKPFEKVCDFFLFDTKGKLPGGNGTAFDWKVLENYPSTKPFFLSGGIGIEEIKKLVEMMQSDVSTKKLPIHAIDVNSKFEIEPGLKNIQLCRDVAMQRLQNK